MTINKLIINNIMINEEIIHKLISDICKKKELKGINFNFVESQLKIFLGKEKGYATFLSQDKINHKSKDYKEIIKLVRSELRRFHGLFSDKEMIKRRESLVKRLNDSNTYENLVDISEKLLETHCSTEERANSYKKLYEKLFSFTGFPRKILDLGCGLNPISLIHFKGIIDQELMYYAYDINDAEKEVLDLFFSKFSSFCNRFKGKSKIFNLFDYDLISQLEKVDICFMFKVTDIIDHGKGHKISEKVITAIPAKFVIVSFPTITTSGKRMNYPNRGWIERMSERLGYSCINFKTNNEIFYIIEK